jgi:fermentation-respiration switch protein FrsA (DUF1100 family)
VWEERQALDDPGSIPTLMLAGIWQIVSHNWALTSILITLFLLIVIPSLIILKYVRICLNIMRDSEPPLFMPRFGFVPFVGEEKDFYAADGVRLRGTLSRAQTPEPLGLIVFAPEFKSDRRSCSRYCRPLLEAGYDIFSIDFRGHGQSSTEENYTPRQWASDRELSDMTGAIAFAEQWLSDQGRPIEMGLFGISRGASSAVLASETCVSVKAIVCDSAFSSDCTLEHFMKRYAKIFAKVRVVYENHPPEFWRFLRWSVFLTCRFKLKCTFPSVRKTLTRMIPRPILFIHGQRDSYIPVEQSRLLYAQSAQPRYLWTVARAKHNESVDIEPDEYARRTVQFFDRFLAGREDADNIFNAGRFETIARSEKAVERISASRVRPRTADREGIALDR